MLADIDFFSFINSLEAIVKKELDSIDVDDIGNLEDLLRVVLIHEECGNFKVFVDSTELTRIINK